MPINVFVSVGRTSTPEQERFVAAIEQYLRDNGLEPRAVGRTAFSSLQPLKFVIELMQECSGTVIIAFERIYIQKGKERRGSEAEKEIRDAKIPTVWNHIEGAIAYTLGHPLLVVVEDELRREGLFETGYDWYVQWVKLDASTLNSREFAGVFNDWKRRVQAYIPKSKGIFQSPGTVDVEKITIGQMIRALTPAQVWKILTAIIAVLSTVATIAYQIGVRVGSAP